MRRVYLDFNHWVAMANAALGKPAKSGHTDALEMARFGVEQGLVEFPISHITYIELLQKKDAKPRERVGAVIVELSRLRTMAPLDLLLPEEIDRALRSRFDRPSSVRSHPVFGRGVGHAFGEDDFRFTLPPQFDGVDEVTRLRATNGLSEVLERAMLTGPSEALGLGEVPGIDAMRELVERHATGEAELGELMRENFPQGGQRFREAWTARALAEMSGALTTAQMRARVHPDEFTGGGKEAMIAFLLDLPTHAAHWELRFLMHRERRAWKGNDLRDLQSLAPAVVHCDVVATERNWKAMIGLTDHAKRHGTTVIDDLVDLPALLAATS